MTSMTVKPAEPVASRQIIIGVDTHKYAHVAVAVDHLGAPWCPARCGQP